MGGGLITRGVAILLVVLLATACGAGGLVTTVVQFFIHIADVNNHRLAQVRDMTGTGWNWFGGEGGVVGQLRTPHGVAVEGVGRIYVADTGNNRIVRKETMTTGWRHLEGFSAPRGVAVHGGYVYVANTGANQIVRFLDDELFTGSGWESFDGAPFGGFNQPNGIWVDGSGRIHVADTDNHRVVRFDDMTGANFVVFGGFGSDVNQFNGPRDILVSGGQIYIADTGNHRIARVNDVLGAGWTTLGSLGAGAGQFQLPSAVARDSQGRIYVADSGNHRITRMNNMSGDGWTTYGTQGSDDHQFDGPHGVAVRSQ